MDCCKLNAERDVDGRDSPVFSFAYENIVNNVDRYSSRRQTEAVWAILRPRFYLADTLFMQAYYKALESLKTAQNPLEAPLNNVSIMAINRRQKELCRNCEEEDSHTT